MVKHESEEVGLLDLFAGAFTTLKKNVTLAIAIPLVGIASGVYYYLSSSNSWESSILMETSLLSLQEAKFLFEQLEKSRLLPGLEEDQQQKVKMLSFEVFDQNEKVNSLNERTVYLQVTARVSEKEVFQPLQQALLNIVNTSSPVLRHRTERTSFYDKLISKIDEEINAMEKVKGQIPGETQATYLNPSLLYSQTVELFREKMTLEIRKEDVASVHLIKGFNTLTFDRKPSFIIPVAVGFVVGLLLLSIILFLKFFASYFRAYQSTH